MDTLFVSLETNCNGGFCPEKQLQPFDKMTLRKMSKQLVLGKTNEGRYQVQAYWSYSSPL
jgi:hypothetical protein